MMQGRQLTVKTMNLAEVGVRINYFHDATDDYLRKLGVDRALLPTREAWREFYEEDYARPLRARLNYLLVWDLDGEVIGFSSADRIVFGEEAFMHLHILSRSQRKRGLGTEFVRRSVEVYFDALELKRLFCEPNAFNVAPNRTLQRAGFSYLFTHEAAPSSINFLQATTRWVLDRSALQSSRQLDRM
ncbi:MAG TPA: GNAT family N-acetyltransferase [Acidimicrobiales bacterium]|nr:GNAT family N-acetyltransferase [Acidimicrobiales bacterium]